MGVSLDYTTFDIADQAGRSDKLVLRKASSQPSLIGLKQSVRRDTDGSDWYGVTMPH